MTSHSVPLSCPYCAGEDLHPHGAEHGAWECRECQRVFSIRFIGLLSVAGGAGSEQRQHVTRGTTS